MSRKVKRKTEGFPKFITDLPEADVQYKGIQAWISQSDNHQVVFFDITPSAEVTEHFHETPQWGVVIEGEIELTINGETKIYGKGDEFHISALAKHSARFRSRFRSIDFFCEKSRYKPKNIWKFSRKLLIRLYRVI